MLDAFSYLRIMPNGIIGCNRSLVEINEGTSERVHIKFIFARDSKIPVVYVVWEVHSNTYAFLKSLIN